MEADDRRATGGHHALQITAAEQAETDCGILQRMLVTERENGLLSRLGRYPAMEVIIMMSGNLCARLTVLHDE